MSLPVKSAIKDVAPGIGEQLPPSLVSYCERLYGKSLAKPLNKASESARYHLCAYLSVEKYASSYNLPSPQFQRIPLHPKICLRLIDEFRDYIEQVKSATSTPKKPRLPLKPVNAPDSNPAQPPPKLDFITNGSPFLESSNSMTPTPHSGKRLYNKDATPVRSSPLKKMRIAAKDTASTTPEKEGTEETHESPFLTPNSKAIKPYSLTESSISIPELIQLSNTFFIPGYITVHIIQEFINQRHKFVKRSDWFLAFGLIYVAYIRINHKLVKDKPDYATTLIQQFHRLRKQLRKNSIEYWCSVINEGVSNSPWIIDIEHTFMIGITKDQHKQELEYKLGPNHKKFEITGMMLNSYTDLLSPSQESYYNTWSSRVLQQLTQR